MKSISDTFFIRMFTLAGLWNAGIGLTGIFFTGFSIDLFFRSDPAAMEFVGVLMFRLFMVAVMIFGVGYYIVSRELMLNRGIIWLGLTSKITLFVLFMFFFITGRATLIAALAVTGDFLWSILFLLFIYQTGHRVKINNIIG